MLRVVSMAVVQSSVSIVQKTKQAYDWLEEASSIVSMQKSTLGSARTANIEKQTSSKTENIVVAKRPMLTTDLNAFFRHFKAVFHKKRLSHNFGIPSFE
jgi:hypothetical protein